MSGFKRGEDSWERPQHASAERECNSTCRLFLDHRLDASSDGVSFIKAEISTLENTGRLPASAYKGATMYTSLSPCDMCTGACVLYKVARVVIGENKTFVGGEAYLKQRGIEVIVLENKECQDLMNKFIEEKPGVW